jgi:hypothetical protein
VQPEHVPTGKGLLASSYNNRADALSNYDNDKSIGAIIITGSEKAFAGRYMLWLHLFLGRLRVTIIAMRIGPVVY